MSSEIKTAKVKIKNASAVTRMAAVRDDSWSNVVIGLGIKNRDKRISATVGYDRMNENELEQMHAGDDIGMRIVHRLPDDMTREWFTLKCNDMTQDQIQETMGILEDLQVQSKFERCLSDARLYGGAGIILGVTGFDNMSDKPLNFDDIGQLEFITALNRWELWGQSPINTDVTSQNFRLPDQYMIQHRTNAANLQQNKFVHWSRVIRFEGQPLARRLFESNNYWGASVFERLVNALRNFQTSHDSLAILMQDFSQAVYKIKDLADIVSSADGIQMIEARMAAVDLCRSTLRAMLIGEDEEFERKTSNVSGIDQIMNIVDRRLVAATDMPRMILFGESPTGKLGESGQAELKQWYDHVGAQQKKHLLHPLNYLLKVLFSSKKGPTKGKIPNNWDIKFNPLWAPSEEEHVSAREKQSKIDKAYVEMGAISPDEVAVSRFGGDSFSFETRLMSERSNFEVEKETDLEDVETESINEE